MHSMTNFDLNFIDNSTIPLAARMRPKRLMDYIGQEHLLNPEKPLYKSILAGHLHSMILWGPPGTGKTTLAEIVAHHANAIVIKLSAVTSGVKEIRSAMDDALINQQRGDKTILFIDEVHRFNKAQQDVFLPFIENGTVTFIGATTENPSFELNSALLSRARVYLLKRLSVEALKGILSHALRDEQNGYGLQTHLKLPDHVKQMIAEFSSGDARRALNTLELMVDMSDDNGELSESLLKEVIGESIARFDNQGDVYYDLISAVHKSIRGSAPDPALYWYARIITAGGDPLYVARRLLAIASEDIGNADPRAMQIALSAWDCFTRVGPAEGERAIAQAIIYLACAPKSNAVYTAFNTALDDAKNQTDYEVPIHLRNAPTSLMKNLGYGDEYRYAHDEENAYAAGENYFPPELSERQYYIPSERGMENQIKQKLAWLKQQDELSPIKRYKK